MDDYILIPEPRLLVPTQGNFIVPEDWPPLFHRLTRDLLYVQDLEYTRNKRLKVQEYILHIGQETVVIEYSSREGSLNGLRTLKQLIAQRDENDSISCLRIEDSYVFPIRGLLLDLSHNRVPILFRLKLRVDFLAEQKINQVHLAIQPNKESLFGGPLLLPLTPEEIESLDSHCQTLGIELILCLRILPYFDSSLEEEKKISVLDEEWFLRVKEVYSQLKSAFSSNVVHIDSRFECLSEERRKESDFTQPEECRLFLSRVLSLIQEDKKEIQIAADPFLLYPDLLEELSPQTVINIHGESANYPFLERVKALKQSGFTLFFAPSTVNKNSIFCRGSNGFFTISNAAQGGIEEGFVGGIILCDWGENGHLNSTAGSILPLNYMSQWAWRGKEVESERLFTFTELVQFGISPQEPEPWLKAYFFISDTLPDELKSLDVSSLLMPFYDEFLPEYRVYYEKCAQVDWTSILTQLELPRAEQLLHTTQYFGPFISSEVSFGLQIFRFCLELCAEFFQTPHFKIEEIPLEKSQYFSKMLALLKDYFTTLWLKGQKPAGLNKTLVYFERLQERLAEPRQLIE